jgi:drug/metabolite transporter (DMT)-like permease
MAAALALFAALAFALGTTLQQRGTLQTDAPEGDPRFLAEIIREPVWLCGALLQACGWVLQAAALDRGTLLVVQSLCTLSLVFALPLGVRLTDQHVSGRSIAGAAATVTGVVLFITVGQPESGNSRPPASAWWTSGVVIGVAMVLLAGVARRHRGGVAAAVFATAAGLGFAFQAAVTKVFVTELGNGVAPLLSSWTTYVLILSALAGFVLQQSALKTGFLAPAMAASNATTLVASVVLGIAIFEESLDGGGRLVVAVLGLVLAAVGVVLLAVPPRSRSSSAEPAASTFPVPDHGEDRADNT